jgi:hypothetical protein
MCFESQSPELNLDIAVVLSVVRAVLWRNLKLVNLKVEVKGEAGGNIMGERERSNGEQKYFCPETEKPPVLYFGSAQKNLEVIKPMPSARDPAEGEVVFAAREKPLATMFIVKSDDSWVIKGHWEGKYHIIISDEKRYRQADKGGAIYYLPSDSFFCDFGKGMGVHEWTSRQAVKPIKKEIFSSGIEAMIQHGVQVRFVDRETFKTLRAIVDEYKATGDSAKREKLLKQGIAVLEQVKPEGKQEGAGDEG